MRLPRSGRNRSQLRHANALRYSDRENFYPGSLRPIRFQQSPSGIHGRLSVSYKNYEFRNTFPTAELCSKHTIDGRTQGCRYIRVSTSQIQISDGVDKWALAVVRIEVELWVDLVAEQQYADLRQLR